MTALISATLSFAISSILAAMITLCFQIYDDIKTNACIFVLLCFMLFVVQLPLWAVAVYNFLKEELR